MGKNKLIIQKLTLGSMFSALGILLKFASFIIPLFGIPMLRVDLIPIPVILAGVILGPFYGLIVGIITDVAGHFILPQGVFHIGFTINLALTGFISGFLMQWFKSKKTVVSVSLLNVILMSILSVGAVLYLIFTNSISIRQNGDLIVYQFTPLFKILSIISILIIFNVVLFPILYRKQKAAQYQKQNEILLIATIIEIFVLVLLTPIWIQSFTDVPYIFNVIPRVFRAMFFIPVKTYLIFYIYKAYQEVVLKLQISPIPSKNL